MKHPALLLGCVLAIAASPIATADEPGSKPRSINGFTLDGASVPPEDIYHGGPPRDGIPALVAPEIVPAADAPWRDGERVIGVVQGGRARAYPLSILVWHELVNDTLGDVPIVVSYCPLCGTGLVFDRRIGGQTLTFGVSGLLYQSDLLMYDRETESLWSQIQADAIVGPHQGRRLTLLRSKITTWGAWRASEPATTTLSSRTGHARAYGRTPYMGYGEHEQLFFPAEYARKYHAKTPTLGLRLAGGTARGYASEEVERAGGLVRETFAGRKIRIAWDDETKTFDVNAPPDVEVIEGFWFAWAAFHPNATVFKAKPTP